jgi:hypothetical protein
MTVIVRRKTAKALTDAAKKKSRGEHFYLKFGIKFLLTASIQSGSKDKVPSSEPLWVISTGVVLRQPSYNKARSDDLERKKSGLEFLTAALAIPTLVGS